MVLKIKHLVCIRLLYHILIYYFLKLYKIVVLFPMLKEESGVSRD